MLKAAVDKVIPSPFYKKTEVQDIYNEMTLSFRGNYGLVFRMYNDGLAYRFTTKMKNDIVVVDEEADYTSLPTIWLCALREQQKGYI